MIDTINTLQIIQQVSIICLYVAMWKVSKIAGFGVAGGQKGVRYEGEYMPSSPEWNLEVAF